MAKKGKKARKSKPKQRKAPKQGKVNKPKRHKSHSNMAKSKRAPSRKRNLMANPVVKIGMGAGIGLAASWLVSKAPPQFAAFADDAGDLVATIAGGKLGLVGNMVGKRLIAPVINSFTGGNQPSGGYVSGGA